MASEELFSQLQYYPEGVPSGLSSSLASHSCTTKILFSIIEPVVPDPTSFAASGSLTCASSNTIQQSLPNQKGKLATRFLKNNGETDLDILQKQEPESSLSFFCLPKRKKERKGRPNPNAPLDLASPRTSGRTTGFIIHDDSYFLFKCFFTSFKRKFLK